MDFECHITVHTDHAEVATRIAKNLHWKTSEIARDPVLGDKNFFYLTTHDNDFGRMYQRMRQCCHELTVEGVPVLREKIEAILHDTKKKLIQSEKSTAEILSEVGSASATAAPGVLWNGPVDGQGRPAPIGSVVQTLNPQAAWPFPTASRNDTI